MQSIARYETKEDVLASQGFLQEVGISSEIRSIPVHVPFVPERGQYEILVGANDVIAAKKVLIDPWDVSSEPSDSFPSCPQCCSVNVTYDSYSYRNVFGQLFHPLMPWLWKQKMYYCFACGNCWKTQ